MSAAPRIGFVIGGVQKGGTTALARFVSRHPALQLPDCKEAHVFDSPDFDESWGVEQIDERYGEHFPDGWHPEMLYGDATPIYCLHPHFVRRIAAYNPDMRWIVILRHPVERAISQYRMERARANESWPLWPASRPGKFGQRPATVALGPGFGQAGMLLRRQCVAGEGLQVVALQVVRELAHRTGGLAGGAGQFTGGGCRALAGTQRKDQGQQQCGGSGGTEGPEARWRHGRRRHPVGPRRVWRQPGGAGKASGKKKGGAWPPQSGRTGGHRVVARLRPRAGRGHPSATQELRQHFKLNNTSC